MRRPVQLEPENWMDLLQAVTFMANPDADSSALLAWTTAHESRLDLWGTRRGSLEDYQHVGRW